MTMIMRMRELEDAEVGFGEDCEGAVADVGSNADLYAANQESTDLINEAHMEEAPLRFMGQDVFAKRLMMKYVLIHEA